ncbi:MAG: GtrA family protein [Syntrophomonadaceae bacterium]|nr:GtrA family protein [Syntrophomonadaceae bacterium]
MKHKIQQLMKYPFNNGERERLIKFFIVGGVNTVFGYSLYALLIYLHIFYALASLLSTIGGVLFNFKTTGVIVFKNHNNRLLFRFVGVYAFNYSWGVGILSIFSIYHVNMYLAGALLILPGALIAYILQKKFVFGGEKSETDKHSNALLQ